MAFCVIIYHYNITYWASLYQSNMCYYKLLIHSNLYIKLRSAIFDRHDDVGLFTLYYCTIVAVSATDRRSNDTLAIYHRLSRYRYLQDGAVTGTFSQLPWTWTRCEVTATEHDTSCDRSVVGISRQISHVAGRPSVLFILRIPLSPTSLLTDVKRRRCDMEVHKTFVFLVNNFQTVNVVYKDVLSWLSYFCMSLSKSLDVWRIFVCVYYINAYVNEYTVTCNEWNSVACNTTRSRLFCFMCVN